MSSNQKQKPHIHRTKGMRKVGFDCPPEDWQAFIAWCHSLGLRSCQVLRILVKALPTVSLEMTSETTQVTRTVTRTGVVMQKHAFPSKSTLLVGGKAEHNMCMKVCDVGLVRLAELAERGRYGEALVSRWELRRRLRLWEAVDFAEDQAESNRHELPRVVTKGH